MKNEIMQKNMFKLNDQELHVLLKTGTQKLQQWVRGSFLCDGICSTELKQFVNVVVKPALSVTISAIPQQMADTMSRYIAILGGSEATAEDATAIKIAACALNGQLSSHPFVQGLCLQARRMLEKRERGLTSMVGRRSVESSRESALIADAALTLSMHAGNSSLAKEFGVSAALCRIRLDHLKQHSLPTFPLALSWPHVLADNFMLADQISPKAPEASRSVFVSI